MTGQDSTASAPKRNGVSDFGERMRAWILQEAGNGLARFSGTHLTGTVPVDGRLANTLLQSAPLPPDGPLKSVAIAFQPGNRAVLLLALERFPLPRQMEIPLTVEPVVEVPGQPVIVLHLQPGGLWGMVVPILLGAIARPGISNQGNTVRLDLAALTPPESRRWLACLRRLELRTEPGRLAIHFDLLVEESA